MGTSCEMIESYHSQNRNSVFLVSSSFLKPIFSQKNSKNEIHDTYYPVVLARSSVCLLQYGNKAILLITSAGFNRDLLLYSFLDNCCSLSHHRIIINIISPVLQLFIDLYY